MSVCFPGYRINAWQHLLSNRLCIQRPHCGPATELKDKWEGQRPCVDASSAESVNERPPSWQPRRHHFQWTRPLTWNLHSRAEPRQITGLRDSVADNAGSIYVCGERNPGGIWDAYVARLDATTGAVIWEVTFRPTAERVTATRTGIHGMEPAVFTSSGTAMLPGEVRYGHIRAETMGLSQQLNTVNGAVIWNTFIGGRWIGFYFPA